MTYSNLSVVHSLRAQASCLLLLSLNVVPPLAAFSQRRGTAQVPALRLMFSVKVSN